MQNLKIWHGSRRWLGFPEIRAPKNRRCEYGPGIYCTTNLNSASRYATSGGRIVQFSLDPEIKWLENIQVEFKNLIEFVKNSSHLRKKKILLNDLIGTYNKKDQSHFKGKIPLSFLVNLAVNNECISGKGGIELAEYLVASGAQASLCKNTNQDSWAVIFDPKAIVEHKVLSSKDIDWKADELLTLAKQIKKNGHSLPY